MIAGETKSSGQKKSDAANESLNSFSNGKFQTMCVVAFDADARSRSGTKKSGDTVKGAGIDAGKQVSNQETGSADHLDMGMRKGV